MPVDRENLDVDGISGEPVSLFVDRDTRRDYRLVDGSGDWVDPTGRVTVFAQVDKGIPPVTDFEALTYQIIPAPDQTPGSPTLGIFQLFCPADQHTTARAPGVVYCDILVDNEVKVPWQAALVDSLAD